MAGSIRTIHRPRRWTGRHRPFILIALVACQANSLCGQSNDCESGVVYSSRIVSESQYLPLELQGFSEYLPPEDPGEVPRKYLVERWSGIRQVHHVHSGGSFTQRLAFSGEWRFEAQTPVDTTTKTIEYLVHRHATGEDDTGSCDNLRTGINSLPGGGCADYSCGDFKVEPTDRGYTSTAEYDSCANGFGYFWTSEDTVSEELLELDTEENAMARAEINGTTGSSNHSFANDFERNWDVYDRTRPVAFHAQRVRFFALFPLTCPGTYTVLYAYRKWAIGSDRPEDPNHFDTDRVSFTEWSTRAPGPSSWIEIPLEKGMNVEIVDAAIFSTCDSTSAGTAQERLSSVDLSISLGGDAAGNPYGVVLLRSTGVTPALAQPGSLQFWNSNPAAVEVIRDTEEIIESIRTPNRLMTVTAVSPTAFRLDHFLTDSDGLDPEASPDITQEITFIDAQEDRILRLSERAFGKTTVREYRDSKTTDRIELVTGNGLRREVLDRSMSDDAITTENRTTYDSSDDLASQTLERYREFPWGRSLIEVVLDPEGAALTATFSYYDDPAVDGSAYGRVRTRTDPSGHWLRYEYDAEGRINRLTEPFLNAPEDADPNELYERVFSYTTIPDQDTDGIEESLEIVDSRLLGQSIGRRFKVELTAVVGFDDKPTEETWELIATDPEANWDDASNLRTVRRIIAEGPFRDRIAQTWLPHGLAVFTRYETLNDFVTVITQTGVEPDEEGRMQRGTINTRIISRDGHLISEETRDIETDHLLDQQVAAASDERGRPTRIEYLDGSFETLTYDCCGQNSGTDRNGLSFMIEYDALGQVAARTTGGVRYEYSYDADGRVTERRRVHPEGGTDTATRYEYDLAGRRLSETDQMGGIRSIAYAELPDGSRVESVTHPDGSETRIVRARDGRPLSIDGSRESPRRYVYGVNENGFYTREIRIGDNDAETEWSETTSDFAARPYLILHADGSQETREFDLRGNLVSMSDRDGTRHLFENDPAGFSSLQAIDMNGNGQVDPDGPDRVTRTSRSLVVENGEPIDRTTVERWVGDGTDEPETFHIADHWLTRQAQRESRGASFVITEARSLPSGDLDITTTESGEPDRRTIYRKADPSSRKSSTTKGTYYARPALFTTPSAG
jgi:YD repeat-containing protein